MPKCDCSNTLEDFDLYWLEWNNPDQILLDAANLFIDSYPNGVTSNDELDLGISLLRELIGIAMIGSLPLVVQKTPETQ